MDSPQIAIVGATPDSEVGDLLQQHVNHALLALPDWVPMQELRNKAGRKSSELCFTCDDFSCMLNILIFFSAWSKEMGFWSVISL